MATARYGVRPAPDGLALVQDFLNTRAGDLTRTDLLSDATHANLWGAPAVHSWSARRGTASEPPALTEHDAAMLRDMRDALDDTLAGGSVETPLLDGVAGFKATGTNRISWLPTGFGWHWFGGAVLGEILLSQHTETWKRLKQCANAGCRATFYDSSWDNSAVWHNGTTCAPSFADVGVQRT
ncbi:CGNR zinc finger domain-containing protein [soil metagenome]